MLTFSGIVGFFMFSAMADSDDTFASSTFESFDNAVRAMTIGMLVLGLVFIALSFYVKKHDEAKLAQERAAEEELSKKLAQNIASAARAAAPVKVRCRYCGALSDENDEKCESCGATL